MPKTPAILLASYRRFLKLGARPMGGLFVFAVDPADLARRLYVAAQRLNN
jgi:hypothetical protein